MRSGSPTPARRQRGAVLLLAALVALFTASYVVLARFDRNAAGVERDLKTQQALASAKQALIAYALTYGERHPVNATPPGSTSENDPTLPPGTLPCPEQSLSGLLGEGAQSPNCGARDTAAIGRLPWRSLGLPPLRDSAGECLWYAVSGSFKSAPAPHLLNRDSLGQFEIHDADGGIIAGSSAAGRAIAVILAPGFALPGQDRFRVAGAEQCGGNYAAGNYLDRLSVGGASYDNAGIDTAAGAVSRLIAGRRSAEFNDRLIYLTADELFAAIEKRSDFAASLYDAADTDGRGATPALTQKVAALTARYGRNNADPADRRLPWAAPLAVADSDSDSFEDHAGQYAGRPSYRVGTSRGATNSQLVPAGCSTTSDKCRLLITDRALPNPSGVDWWRVAGKPLYGTTGASRMDSPEGWWDKWKDHLYYVVSPEFAPASSTDWAATPNPCAVPGNRCVTVDGRRYAAVIVFAGARQGGQQRATPAQRQDVSNYLEAPNDAAFADPTTAITRILATAGNDRLVCLRAEDLSLDSSCSTGTP